MFSLRRNYCFSVAHWNRVSWCLHPSSGAIRTARNQPHTHDSPFPFPLSLQGKRGPDPPGSSMTQLAAWPLLQGSGRDPESPGGFSSPSFVTCGKSRGLLWIAVSPCVLSISMPPGLLSVQEACSSLVVLWDTQREAGERGEPACQPSLEHLEPEICLN